MKHTCAFICLDLFYSGIPGNTLSKACTKDKISIVIAFSVYSSHQALKALLWQRLMGDANKTNACFISVRMTTYSDFTLQYCRYPFSLEFGQYKAWFIFSKIQINGQVEARVIEGSFDKGMGLCLHSHSSECPVSSASTLTQIMT